jgi:ATP-binding cassette subfamily B protein
LCDTTIWQIIPLLSAFVFAFTILGFQLPLFALAMAILCTIFITVAWLSFRKVRVLNEKEAAASSRLTGQLADSVTNISAVKGFAREPHEA